MRVCQNVYIHTHVSKMSLFSQAAFSKLKLQDFPLCIVTHIANVINDIPPFLYYIRGCCRTAATSSQLPVTEVSQ